MDEVIFLEVLEGDGVDARHRLERFPATVGRAYTNDVILDDPKVSAEHLRIERREDGVLVVRDAGSQNGTWRVDPWARLAEMELVSDARVAVGDTVLRFRSRDHVVADTVVAEAPAAPRERLFERGLALPVAMLALLGTSLLEAYLGNYARTDWGSLTVAVVMPLALTLLWAGGWAVASRISRRQFHYRTHTTIACLVLLGAVVLPPAITALGFGLSLGRGLGWLQHLAFLGLMGWGLFWHLRYVTRWQSGRLVRVLAVVTLVFGALSRADDLLGNEPFSTSLEFPRTLLPPSFRLSGERSVEAFFAGTEGLQEEVDALVREE
ncbi:FHA domain-containing protein [Myxococcus sp. K15C18031901]|uniref:FHA domain-containing protein n=1 Tax=Myxococcus dinghuensis TaxID=2906761 RepID=UPI0020A81257|nr:FHA domain-containing protein [Myxococcus dinghuensis]MCP3100430.1 FHA domain-containing protein [Myxococcus dinghuensis]